MRAQAGAAATNARPDSLVLTSLTTAAAPAAASAAANTVAFSAASTTRVLLDLGSYTQVRLTAAVVASGNAVGASLKLSYMLTQNATWAGTDAGPVCVLGTNGGVAGIVHDSGWQPLPVGARVANVALNVLVGTAFGTTAPTIGNLVAYFR